MKKLTCLLLCLSLALALAACDNTPATTDPPVETTTAPTDGTTAAPTTEQTLGPVPVVYDLPMSAITMTEQAETAANGDGTVIFEYHYQNVWLHLTDADIAEAVTLDLLNRIDSTRAAADSILTDANAANPDYPYSLTIHYEPRRIDNGVLSLSGLLTSYNGGSHANSSCVGVTYDLTTGKALTLGDILSDGCTADTICRLTVDALADIADSSYLYEDYSATLEERFGEKFMDDSGWYLSGDGLCFDFAPYEIAPYSSGVVTAVIPYDRLTGVLEDAYFPVEQITADGELLGVWFDEADLNSFEQFAEVVLSESGESQVFYTDGLLYDITIDIGRMNSAGTVFTHETTVFAASSLTPGTGIVLQADRDTYIRITYTANGQTVQTIMKLIRE